MKNDSNRLTMEGGGSIEFKEPRKRTVRDVFNFYGMFQRARQKRLSPSAQRRAAHAAGGTVPNARRAPRGLVVQKGTCGCPVGPKGRRPVPRGGYCTKCSKARR